METDRPFLAVTAPAVVVIAPPVVRATLTSALGTAPNVGPATSSIVEYFICRLFEVETPPTSPVVGFASRISNLTGALVVNEPLVLTVSVPSTSGAPPSPVIATEAPGVTVAEAPSKTMLALPGTSVARAAPETADRRVAITNFFTGSLSRNKLLSFNALHFTNLLSEK